MTAPSSLPRQVLIWAAIFVIACVLPSLFRSGFLVSVLSQIAIMAVFALSYNMLLGQTGLLSFGHAVYYGLGAFATIHLLNGLGKSATPLLVALLPLGGGAAGLVAGLILGRMTTKKAGTTFAMISLGIAELMFATTPIFPSVFGGDGGFAGNRMAGKGSFLGLTWGPQIEIYWLVLFWAFVSAGLMFALTQTPLGRVANAVRDNPERAEFIGYDTRQVRYRMLVLSGLFAGIAGGLSALNYEIVTVDMLNAHTSGSVLLMTYTGGIGHFFGPVLGAAMITLMQTLVGGLTHAWLLYFGLFFLFMVAFAPGGMASVLSRQSALVKAGLWRCLLPHYALAAAPAALACLGAVGLIEMAYALLAGHDAASFMGTSIRLHTLLPWLGAASVLIGGIAGLKWVIGGMSDAWHQALSQLQGGKP
ncbi:MAG: branched-chain amino acid ABC transporter permease [Magnetospirillum sp.]